MADKRLQPLTSTAKRPDQTMIERLARLLCLQRGGDPDVAVQAGDATGVLVKRTAWELHEDDACAILAAMREPTPALLDAMMAAESATRDNVAIWNAAIDAAVGEALG